MAEEINIKKDFEAYLESKERLQVVKFYKALPETSCACCGQCCLDPPEVTYTEFLHVLSNMKTIELSTSEIYALFYGMLRCKIYGLIKPSACAFLQSNKYCMIHKFSPISCKRWGLQPISEYENDIRAADNQNENYSSFYAEKGITIPQERMDYRTPYCDKVMVQGKKLVLTKAYFETIYGPLISFMSSRQESVRIGYRLHDYFLASFFNDNRLFFDRIRILKKYRNDNDAITDYLSSFCFDDGIRKFQELLSDT